MTSEVDLQRAIAVRRKVIRWFDHHGKRHPWRETDNPFHILVAEILLRRTTATAVARVYPIFIKRFPTPKDLATAHENEIAQQLETLGLQRIRAAQMKTTALRLVEEHKGEVPSDLNTLQDLPGVGRYIAAAVVNLAFGCAEPMVDGNIAHILNRIFTLSLKGPNDTLAWETARTVGGKKQDIRLYWGMIDLVQTVCLRRQPRCKICPLNGFCDYISDS